MFAGVDTAMMPLSPSTMTSRASAAVGATSPERRRRSSSCFSVSLKLGGSVVCVEPEDDGADMLLGDCLLPAHPRLGPEQRRLNARAVVLDAARGAGDGGVDDFSDLRVGLRLPGVDLRGERLTQCLFADRSAGLPVLDQLANFAFGDTKADHRLDSVALLRGRLEALAHTI